MVWLIYIMTYVLRAPYCKLVHISDQHRQCCCIFIIISCLSFRIMSESSRGREEVFPSWPLFCWDQLSNTRTGKCPTQHCSQHCSTSSLFLYLLKERHCEVALGFLFQILSMCSDPFASVEREQSCTLAPVARQTLTPSNVSAPRGGLDDLSGLKFIK